MIAAILAVFTAAALMGAEAPELVSAYRTLEACQLAADNKETKDKARQHGVVVLCLQLRTGV